MNLELLREFSLEAAQRGEEICYLDGDKVDFIGTTTAGDVAVHYAKYVRVYIESLLRMKPLAWVENRPVYKGDVLYSKITGHPRTVIKIENLNDSLIVRFEEADSYVYLKDCSWTKPEPVKKTRTVKFLGYRTGCGELVLIDESEDEWEGFKRVPSADVTYEVEE